MSRVRYEHGFEYDLFISYAHKDNQDPEKWVEAFVARLQKRLDEVTGKEIKIWRDARQLGPGFLLDPAVTQAVENSALLLIVLSPSWLASDWCPREHSLFQATGRQAVANRSRVLAAERYPVEKYPPDVSICPYLPLLRPTGGRHPRAPLRQQNRNQRRPFRRTLLDPGGPSRCHPGRTGT